jgi:hypothetical protein
VFESRRGHQLSQGFAGGVPDGTCQHRVSKNPALRLANGAAEVGHLVVVRSSMALSKDEEQEFRTQLERLTEGEIRMRMIELLWRPDKRKIAESFLEEKAKAARAEGVEIARSAKDAAWEAVKTAKGSNKIAEDANRIAMLALAASMISAIIALLALLNGL